MTGAQRTVVGLAVLLVVGAAGYLGYGLWDQHRDHRDYPTSIRDEFLVTCAALSTGDTDSTCRCALNDLEERYSLSEFTQLSRANVERGDGGAAQPVIDALGRCGGTYTPPPATVTSVDHSLYGTTGTGD